MSTKKYTMPKIEELLDAGVHFGHQIKRWNPKMEKYIYTAKMGIHVIDLEKSHELLEKACEEIFNVAAKGGEIVFVGTKKQAAEVIKSEAQRCGAYYVNERWLGGTITNFDIIRININKLVEYKRKREAGEFGHYTKKERLMIDREIERLERNVGGIVGLKGTPKAIFVVDAKRENTAVREAKLYKVPVFALIDTNTNPDPIDYMIPGNDDAIRSIVVVLKAISEAVESGYKFFDENKEKIEQKLRDDKIQKERDTLEMKVTSSESKASTKDAGKKAVKHVEILDNDIEEDKVKKVLEKDSSVKTENKKEVKTETKKKPKKTSKSKETAKKETKVVKKPSKKSKK